MFPEKKKIQSDALLPTPCFAQPVKSAEEVIREIDDMIEEDEKRHQDQEDEDDDGDAGRLHHNLLPSAFSSSCQRSSRMVSQALAGRKLDELSANELTQILSDIELLVRKLYNMYTFKN